MCQIADPGVVSLILALSQTIAESDHEIIYAAILHPSADSRRLLSVKGKSMCIKYLLTA